MNELDRKKFAVYERTLGRFVDKLREFSYKILEEIHGNRAYIRANVDSLAGLIDMAEKIESAIKQVRIELNHQNSNMEKFRTEIRSSLERGFTEQRERIKRLKKGLPDEEILEFAEAKEITSGPTFDIGDHTAHIWPDRNIVEPKKKVSFFGIGWVSVEL